MASLDLTTADPILKSIYKTKFMQNVTMARHPGLGVLEKDETFKGRNMPIPIQYGNPMGRSGTFSKAQANATPAKFSDFYLTRRKDYGVATVDGETAEATEGDAGAFISALAAQIDGALKSVSDSLAGAIYRNGTGSIGQVGSFSTNTLTLLVDRDVALFEVGMTLQSNATDGGTPRAGTEILAGIDRTAGKLTSTSASWATVITAIAANDYLLVEGDNNAKVHGFDGWIKQVAPTSGDNWFQVDRSTDTRLAGQRYDATGGDSVEEAAIGAQSLTAQEGGTPDIFIVHNSKLRDFQKGAASKTTYERVVVNAKGKDGAIATIGYRGIIIDGDEGPITVLADPRCPKKVGWMLQSDTVGLYSIGPAPKLLMKDGLRIQRQATADGYEVRCGLYGNVAFSAPGWCSRVDFAS